MTSSRRGNPLRDLPLPALYVVTAGLWTAVQLIFHSGPITGITLLTTAVGGLLFAAVLTLVAAAARRRLGGATQVSAFNRALRTGTPPPDADTTRWLQELDRLDRTRTRRTLVPVAATAIPIGIGIWALTDPDARPIALVLILVVIALDITVITLLPTQRRRAQRLRQNLSTPGQPAHPGG